MQWIENIAYSISKNSRTKKFQFFLDTIKPTEKESIVDVGVNDIEYSPTDNYLEGHFAYPHNITAVAHESLEHFKKTHPDVKAIVADGTKLPFEDNAFDIAYSNAVIEHVGKHLQQQLFVTELVRVSKRGFITTPNRHFPVEVHTRVPLLHLILSKKYFDIFLKLIGKQWATKDYMNLLSYQDIHDLFSSVPNCQFHIHKHRFFGLTMTFSISWIKTQ